MIQSILDSLDFTLLITVSFIFAVSLIGAWLRSRYCDPCLQSFASYRVTVKRKDSKSIWGLLEALPTGLELHYRNSVHDSHHVESSYILYSEEYEEMQAIYRYVDQLSADDRKRRERAVNRHLHPNLLWQILRKIQIFFSTATDSLNEVIGLLMGRLQTKSAGRYLTEAGTTQVQAFGKEVFTHVGLRHDPLLERLVGHKVVVEVIENSEIHEHVGIFKNYSADFIELLDVNIPEKIQLTFGQNVPASHQFVQAEWRANQLIVTNSGECPVLLQTIRDQAHEEIINLVVDGGQTVEIQFERDFSEPRLEAHVVREVDMIVPRALCMVRHRAENYKSEVLPDIIFDLGVLLRGNSLQDAQEARFRKELERNPTAAWAAARLGTLLMRRQQFEEARVLLESALSMKYSLPDNGRRTAMLLRELHRRHSR